MLAIRSSLWMASVLVSLAGCTAAMRADDAQVVDVSKVLSAPESQNDLVVRLHACVNVTMHDVTLLSCGTKNPQLNIEGGAGGKAQEAFLRLVDFAHAHMGEEPEELPVLVEGIYRGQRMGNEYRHTLYVADFRPESK